MDVILASIMGSCAIVYTDDGIIFFNSLKEHVTHINEILILLKTSEMN